MRSMRTISARIAIATVAAAMVAVATVGVSTTQVALTKQQATMAAAMDTTWTPVGTLDPQHVYSANTQLVLYGVHAFTANNVTFNQQVMPASIPQIAVPYIRVPDGNPHTYRLRFHLTTNGTTNAQYRLADNLGNEISTVTVAPGDTTIDFIVNVQLAGVGWKYWTLKNLSGNIWVFYSCQIDEQTS
jgi:hypothetical protein